MMKSIKRMILAGAAVMVMMSFAAPAMANDYDAVGPLKYSSTDISYPAQHGSIVPATGVSDYSIPTPYPYPDPYPCFSARPC